MFILLNANHDYTTRAGCKNILDPPPSQSTHCGENSIRAKATSYLNLLQRITIVNLLTYDLHELKKKQFVTSIMLTTNNLHNNNYKHRKQAGILSLY